MDPHTSGAFSTIRTVIDRPQVKQATLRFYVRNDSPFDGYFQHPVNAGTTMGVKLQKFQTTEIGPLEWPIRSGVFVAPTGCVLDITTFVTFP